MVATGRKIKKNLRAKTREELDGDFLFFVEQARDGQEGEIPEEGADAACCEARCLSRSEVPRESEHGDEEGEEPLGVQKAKRGSRPC